MRLPFKCSRRAVRTSADRLLLDRRASRSTARRSSSSRTIWTAFIMWILFNMIINSQASACAPAARAGCQSPTPDRSGDGLLATVAIPDAVAVPDAVARARLEGDGTGTNAPRTENFGHGRPEPRNEARRRGCRDDHGQEASLARAKDEVRGPG